MRHSGQAMTMNAERIAPGAWRIDVPLDGHSIGSVNCFAFASPEGLMLLDPGWGTEAVQDKLAATIAGLEVDAHEVVLVVASHVHADHAGGLGYWRRRGAEIAIGVREADQLARRYLGDEFRRATHQWSEQAGLPPALATAAQRQVDGWQELVEVAPITRELHDGDEFAFGSFSFVVVETPGHTVGHVCLLERTNGLLLSGDTLFERITYGPTFRPILFDDPLGAFRASLERLGSLDGSVTTVHPGHLLAFEGLAIRTEEVLGHHAGRQIHVRDAIELAPRTAYEIASSIPRTRDWEDLRAMQMLSAVGDVLAHLVNLEASGQVQRIEVAHGAHRWTTRS